MTTITLPLKCSTAKDIWMLGKLVGMFVLLWAMFSTLVMIACIPLIIILGLSEMISPIIVFGVGFVLTLALFAWIASESKIVCIKDEEDTP